MTNSHSTPSSSVSFHAGDAYIAFEDMDNPVVDSWVNAQTVLTRKTFSHTARADKLTEKLVKEMTADKRIVHCWRCNDWGYNLWVDETHPLCFVRRTPWDAWIQGSPQWEMVFDTNALDLNQQDENDTRWTLTRFDLIYPSYDRALVWLSPGGSDANIVKEFHLEKRAFVEGGFEIPEPGHHSVSWIDRDTVYVSWGDRAMHEIPVVTTAGYPRQVRKWSRGTPLDAAKIVFECGTEDIGASAFYDPVLKRHLAYRQTSLFETEQFWLDERSEEWQRYRLPLDATVLEWAGWLFMTLRSDWVINEVKHCGGTLLAIQREAFLNDRHHFEVLFSPGERNVLSGVQNTKHYLIVTYKSESITHMTLWQPPGDGETWKASAYPLPSGSETSVTVVHEERDDTVLFYVNHFLTPPSLYFADLADDTPWRLVGQRPACFDSAGFFAEHRYVSASDGTPIPYWLIGHKKSDQMHPRPCLLYGYGGFEVSVDTPYYLDGMERSWLEEGGVYVIAGIRGGGEFGPAWHQAAVRENRQIAFNDFIAVAEELINSGVTTPGQLAITGESNGGLLTAVCMIQRPELFGAVVSEVPLLDMLRFHLLSQGAAWVSEYGDPANAADRQMLMAYSPYHNVKPDVLYPPVLFTSSLSDDRVHPGHARKMVAKMHASGHSNVWYLEHHDGGHGAGVEPESIARAKATIYDFLLTNLKEPVNSGEQRPE